MWAGFVRIAGKDVKISGEDDSYAEVNACLSWLALNAGGTLLQSMPDKERNVKYNGWPNYPTWLIYTWLGSDQEDYLKARRIAVRAKSIGRAADSLKKLIEKKDPLADGANMFADMVSYAINQVDWMRLAERLIEDSKE